jgi:hypothetical protein
MDLASATEVGPSVRAATKRLGLPTGVATPDLRRAQ